MISYQIESWSDYYKDCQELWEEYYQEISIDKQNLRLSMDIDRYKMMEDAGVLKIVTARLDGVMIGFQLNLLTTHLHYKEILCGFQDLLFLSKAYRKGWAGIKLIKKSEQILKSQGAKYLFFGSHPSRSSKKIFSYLGFNENDTTYIKNIG